MPARLRADVKVEVVSFGDRVLRYDVHCSYEASPALGSPSSRHA